MTKLLELPLDKLKPGRHQPRSNAASSGIERLAESIKATGGVISPVVITPPCPIDETHEIIAGERRWRASKLAGLQTIRCLQLEGFDEDDFQAAAFALLENIDRQDLSEVDVANAVIRLKEEFGLTQREIATRLGKSAADVSRLVGLGKLPSQIQDLVAGDQLSWSHAKVLVGKSIPLDQKISLAVKSAAESWSVKQLQWFAQEQERADITKQTDEAINTDRLARALEQALGARVTITHSKKTRTLDLQIKSSAPTVLSGLMAKIAELSDQVSSGSVDDDSACTIRITGNYEAFTWLPDDE
jgi:ParB family chromosome partitioning protein